jgi:predicted nucleic acid-binding Zn ribbon protein
MKETKRKRKRPATASEVLESLLRSSKSPLGEQFIRWRVWNSWPEIVGEQVAKNTLPVSFLSGDLYVWVKHPARLQELTFCAKALLDKINAFCGKKWARQIRFTLDKKSVPQLEEMSETSRKFIGKPE